MDAVSSVATAVEDDGVIRAGTLPAGRFAIMTHSGPPDTLAAATAESVPARGLTTLRDR
jgi:DNA gyrase inhibitor GyrI